MVVLANPDLEDISVIRSHKASPYFSGFPAVDLSAPGSAAAILDACQEFGFFKLTNHGIPTEMIKALEEEAVRFFSLPEMEKVRAGLASPFGYGSKKIGPNGDVGWVEYLLFQITTKPISHPSLAFLRESAASLFRSALNEYISSMRNLTCSLLELIADGLGIKPRNIFSRLVIEEGSETILRLNHYPPYTMLLGQNCSLTGFGEHTDPQLISIQRSNDSPGLQIALSDGSWVSVLPDQDSFFVNVGDALQVLTNKRLRSVKHRVLANGLKSRISMIYFGGPHPTTRIAPLQEVMEEGEQSFYREFTWSEYRKATYKSRLADNRLGKFEC